jgi:hypothetical protein
MVPAVGRRDPGHFAGTGEAAADVVDCQAAVASLWLSAVEQPRSTAASSESSFCSLVRGSVRGSPGISMVTSSAKLPPTTASRLRVNGPPAGAGSSTTSTDCKASWVVKMTPLSRKRASSTEMNMTMAACQIPAPSTCTSMSPTAMPSVQPIATSSTLRTRGPLAKPRAISAEVAAKIGP